MSAMTDDLLTPRQVAVRFGVTPETVGRWADLGRLSAIRTPGGHRRYRRSEVEAMAQAGTTEAVTA